jgi:hypothetical protein
MARSLGMIEVSRPDGRWLVEGDMLRQTIRSYTSAELFLANYSEKTLAETEKESSFGEAVSSLLFEWFVPEVKVVDMNMAKVRSDIIDLTERRLQAVLVGQYKPMSQTKSELAQAIDKGKRDKQLFRTKTSGLQQRNNTVINEAVSKYDMAIEGAKITRDASIDTLVVGATVATGGTGGALIAIAGGAGTAKGLAKYQDTNNVGAAMITGTVGAMTTLLKIPADKMPKGAEKIGTEAVIVFLDVVGDVGSDMATGKSVQDALTDATIKQVASLGIGKAGDKIKVESQLKNLVADRGFKTVVPSIIQPMAVETGKKTAEKISEEVLKAGVNAISGSKSEAENALLSTANLENSSDRINYMIQRAL